MQETTVNLARQLGDRLISKAMFVTCAESCTGGGLSFYLTSIPKSSNWFARGFVTYSNQAKVEMLGIDSNLIQVHGAVSREVALAMAEGAYQKASAHLSVGITGIAGPDGGSVDKPVGMVWIAWKSVLGVDAKCFIFKGDRLSVREQAIEAALVGLLDKV